MNPKSKNRSAEYVYDDDYQFFTVKDWWCIALIAAIVLSSFIGMAYIISTFINQVISLPTPKS